jgi:hypothetical protein
MSLTDTQSTRVNSVAPTSINELEASQVSRATLQGQLLQRRRRRRLDLHSVAGLLRESAKVYRLLADEEITMAAAEVRSRVLKRHGEMLIGQEVVALQQQLRQVELDTRANAYGDAGAAFESDAGMPMSSR